jgi:hypothetical protein
LSVRALRRLWLGGLWLLLPWPIVVMNDAWVPAVRYLILGCVAAAVAVTEGAAGPVGPLVFFFLGWALLTTLGCWGLAWIVARGLGHLPPAVASAVSWLCLGVGLLVALFASPYVTPFGRARIGGLLQVLS